MTIFNTLHFEMSDIELFIVKQGLIELFYFTASTEILLDMVGKLNNPKVALVHQMPYTTDQAGLAAAVEKVKLKSCQYKTVQT